MHRDLLKKIIHGISAASKGLRLYPPEHPAIRKQAEALHRDFPSLFEEKTRLKMGLIEGTLFFDTHMFVSKDGTDPAAEEICRLLTSRELIGVEFREGLTAEEIQFFFRCLAEKNLVGQTLSAAIKEQGQHIRPIVDGDEEDQDTEEEAPLKTYQRALNAVNQIFNEVRMGRIPSSQKAIGAVKNMVKATLADPHALLILSQLKDYDNYTFTHSVNVSVISLAIGHACELPESKLHTLGLGALLHDIGKLIIDKGIINKPGRLTVEEYEEIKKHPSSGLAMASKMAGVSEESLQIILGHHLRYDRKGYPDDARDQKFSLLTDMTALADTYDAMTTLRSYQLPFTPRAALNNLRKMSGSAVHPKLLEKLIESLGNYPVGSLVRLDNNEIGIVIRVPNRERRGIELKIVFSASGEKLATPVKAVLNDAESERIVAEVDPMSRDIEIANYIV